MLHEVGIQFPCVMSAYPRIRVSMFSTAYPRIRVSTSQYSLKFTWGGVVLSTAYPRIQPFQRCSFKVAGYSAVKPSVRLLTSHHFTNNTTPRRFQSLSTSVSSAALPRWIIKTVHGFLKERKRKKQGRT